MSSSFRKSEYTHIGGVAAMPAQGIGGLDLDVYLSADNGGKVRVASMGSTTDEAIQNAIDFANRHSGGVDLGWIADEWESA